MSVDTDSKYLPDDGCDDCGKRAELYYNEATGLALCEACDMAREAVQAAREAAPAEPFDSLLAERVTAGLTVRLNWLPSQDCCALNVSFNGVPMAVTVPSEQAWDAFQHPLIYLAPAQVSEMGIH